MDSATKTKLITIAKLVGVLIFLVIILITKPYKSEHLQNIVKDAETPHDFRLVSKWAMGTEREIFVKGQYNGEEISGYFPIANFDCPIDIEFRSKNKTLSYEIDESDMKKFKKEQTDKCVSYYAQLITEKLSKESLARKANFESYKN